MKKRNLLKLALLTLAALPIGAWAQINFGTEETVSSTTTWTFNDYVASATTSTCAAGDTKTQIAKLYNRSATSGRGFTFSEISSTKLTFSDGYVVNVTKKATSSAAFNNNNMNAKTAGTAGNESTPYFAFNATGAGTCYAFIKNTGTSRICFGKADGSTSIAYTASTSTGIEEVKFKSSGEGVFFIGPVSSNSCEIYAIRFVPDSEENDEWVYIGETGYATWGNNSGKDIESLPAGLTAYKATAGTDNHSVTLTSLDKMRRGQGYVIKGTANTNYGLTYGGTSLPDSYNGGDMVRVNADMADFAPTNGETGDALRNRYILGNDGGTAKFFVPSGSGTLKKGKAYLQTKKTLTPEVSARGIDILIEDGTTGIMQITKSKYGADEYFNLAGQRIANPTKGLYIVNGKKVIVK